MRYALFWLRENVKDPNERDVLKRVHEGLYKKLRQEFNLPSKVAQDCYRDALAVYKAWFNNPNRGKFPRVYRPSVWLTVCPYTFIPITPRPFTARCRDLALSHLPTPRTGGSWIMWGKLP